MCLNTTRHCVPFYSSPILKIQLKNENFNFSRFCYCRPIYLQGLSRFRFHILTAAKMSMLIFYVVTSCGLVRGYKYCLHHQGALMMEAVRTSETSVYSSETTLRYIPAGYHLHTRRRENLKSHITVIAAMRRLF
jgi:hypothetical protein